jgi:cell division protein FtsB
MRTSGLIIVLVGTCPLLAHADSPSYHKHVTALFSKLGCNGGTCHGAVRGQNGFRLSLFGADPLADRERLLREADGRRISLTDPDASLILLKASGQSSHGGGKRIAVGSWEYELLRKWIAAGAPADDSAAAQVKELRVQPAEQVVKRGETASLRVDAIFADGQIEDVTRFCSFQSLDPQVAAVDANGRLEGKGVGDAAVIVRYRAHLAMMGVLVPRPGSAAFPEVSAKNFIDSHVLEKLRRLNLPPSPLADDVTFLRRVSLDICGELPTPDEVRQFLADTRDDKRQLKIEELLKRPGHAALWTLKFCDLLKAADYGVYADALSLEADAPRFQAWVRARLEENIPYDQFVERILLATSREGRPVEEYGDEVAKMMEGFAPGRPDLELYKKRKTLDLYWQRRGSDGVSGAMQVAHAFLGLRLECAQCHRHPHDVWQQDDLLSFANFFMRVRRVGFEGDNEKKYPDTAALFKKFNDEGKKLEADLKKRRETEGKKIDDDAKKAKAEVDKLSREIAQLEKDKKPDEAARKRKEMAGHQETMAKADKFRQEMAALDKKAKLMPEIARRLMQAEVRLKPPGTFAKVTSPIGSAESKTLRLLGETQSVRVADDLDPRELVMQWMRRPDNPYFAKAIVNRVWAHYFGRGVIDPPDNLSSFNPATHPELLKELCDGFIQNKYDLRWLHRTILSSRTYQQSSTATKDNQVDRANYAYFPMRRLDAEVFLDALNTATGTTEKMDMKYYHWPEEIKTVEVPYPPSQNAFVSYILENFGRPKRNSAVQCDCERDGGASVFQVLTLANHPRVWEKIKDANGRVAKLLKEKGADASRVDDLFLATLSRFPTEAERAACLAHMKNAESAEKGLQGVLWSLLNTREFVVQH